MKIHEILKERPQSKCQIAMSANIVPGDFYQALNGKKPFFPAWRKRISEVLNMPEHEVFPEFETKEGA